MKYIKLFEELNRISVTPEEKVKLKEVTKRWLSLLNDTKTGIIEKKTLEYGLGDLSRLTMDAADYIKMAHWNNKYKLVDEVAKKLSAERGVPIIFDRKKNCFTTSSGKALVTFNMVSNPVSTFGIPVSRGAAWLNNWKTSVWINYKTGVYFNDTTKNAKQFDSNRKIINSDFIKVLDLTGGNIILPIDINKTLKTNGLWPDMFSIVYHEFIHSKDPLCWLPIVGYATPEQQKAGIKGQYGGHVTELQTIGNNLLEIVGYYFERTLRGDTDGGGLNYGLTKDYVMNYFIPTIKEVRDFIKGDRDDLSKLVYEQLSGTNKYSRSLEKFIGYLKDGRDNNPQEFKSIVEWMKDDFVRLIEMYNKKVTEINKKKSADDLLPILAPVIK